MLDYNTPANEQRLNDTQDQERWCGKDPHDTTIHPLNIQIMAPVVQNNYDTLIGLWAELLVQLVQQEQQPRPDALLSHRSSDKPESTTI
jgi:hypothetical protein